MLGAISGWKTYVAGFGSIVTGVVGLVLHFIDPANSAALTIEQAAALIWGGLGLIGIGHKIDKTVKEDVK